MTRFGRKILSGRRRRNRHRRKACVFHNGLCQTLADAPVGCRVCVRGFSSGLSSERRDCLQAYGLVPGYCVRILQHFPVTIVQVENMELALEDNLARYVQVESQ